MKRLYIDTGGTFTDCLVVDEHETLRQFKASTTPEAPEHGLLEAVSRAARSYGQPLNELLAQVEMLILGTTLATNAVLTHRGAKTGFITTKNFRDIIEIRRGIRGIENRNMYNQVIPPYRPLVPRFMRRGVEERTLYDGQVLTSLDEHETRQAVAMLGNLGVEAVAIGFLHSYANPENERRAAEICREVLPGVYVTTSHEILPVWREFERFSTTVVSAYVGPIVQRFLSKLTDRLKEEGFGGKLLVVTSSSLVQTVDECVRRAVFVLGSGPAAAPTGAIEIGGSLGERNLLSVDMGGTSFDVCLIRDAEVPTTTENWVGDERVATKMVDVHSVGAGGGSIAWIDKLGVLRVGPQSAGADPGPACYGKGNDQPTVTDADVVLGYIPTDYFLGGEMSLDRSLAEQAVARLGEKLGLGLMETANSIFTTVNAVMANQIHEISTMRGHDVRDLVLVAGGGAGPVHAAFLARALGIRSVIVPPAAALYSAYGMTAMDLGRDYARSYVVRLGGLDPQAIDSLYREMEDEARAAFRELDAAPERLVLSRSAELRYNRQFHELEVPVPPGPVTTDTVAEIVEVFHRRHEASYRFSMPGQAIEFLTFRLKASVPHAPVQPQRVAAGGPDAVGALKRRRECWFDAERVDTPVYDGDRLESGNVVVGPAVVEERTTTVVVPAGFSCCVDSIKNYLLQAGVPSADAPAAGVANAQAGQSGGTMTQSSSVTVDPTTLATVWHHLQTTCREMRHLLERTCQNYLIGQLRDVSVGLWGADGQMLAAPLGMPNQFMGTGLAIQVVYEKFGKDLHPGDVILTNDPYGAHCPHLPDWGFIRPIFYKGELLFFTMVRGHQEDTGGSYPGGYFPNGYDIHAEGIRIPPIKVFDRGQERTDIFELVWNNVRFPRGIRIDNYAMIAATTLAEDRMLALVDRYGRDTVMASIYEMIDRIERAVRADIRKIPDGTYHGESATDDDGTILDEPVWVRVDITVQGDEITLDFSKSDKQRKGFVNMIYAASYSQAVAAVLCMLDPELADYHNEGSLRPIKIVNPKGMVVNAQYPATVGASPVNVGTQVMEAVLEAMSKARPERAQAAWGKHRGDYVFGVDPRSGEPYVRTSFDYDGSAGGVWGYDGPHGPCVQVSLASIRKGNMEEMEVRVPWRMLKYELATDLMGAGKWRGGAGLVWESTNEGSEAGMATGSSDGDEQQGYGALGGQPSPQARTFLLRNGESMRLKPHRMYQIQNGDVVAKRSPGGGGVGPPEERDPEAVKDDVLNELVSLEAARDTYQVALDPRTLEVDWDETKRLRGQS